MLRRIWTRLKAGLAARLAANLLVNLIVAALAPLPVIGVVVRVVAMIC